jgi:LAO/AO transport system kinase
VATGDLGAAVARLVERFQAGQRPALARAITVVENQRPGFQELLHDVLGGGLQARRVGFTGPPGAGKSSLVSDLAARYRKRDEEVAIVAVDPTSPYSGGALLGDRIRMNELATDPGTFIRSMATRGSLGGLATTTREVIDLMDAFGFPQVLVETVGVGQTELEITGAADTVVVVLVPESGDAIQAMKAGLMEIADIFVVNKADRPGADRLVKEISLAIHLRAGEALKDIPAHHGVDLKRVGPRGAEGRGVEEPGQVPRADGQPGARKPGRRWERHRPEAGEWKIPVLKTVAQTGEGVDALATAIQEHRTYLKSSRELERRRRERAAGRGRDVVERELSRIVWGSVDTSEVLIEGVEAVATGVETPYTVARRIVERHLGRVDTALPE